MHVRRGSWTIQRQMVLGSAVLLAMMGTLVVGANLLLHGIQHEVRTLTANVSPSVVQLLNIDRDGYQAQLALERLVTGSAGADAAAQSDAAADWDENTAQTRSRFDDFVELSAELPGEEEQRNEIVALRTAWLEAGEATLTAPPDQQAASLEATRAAFGTYREQLDELESDVYEAEASHLVDRVRDRQQVLVVSSWLALAAALVVGAVFVRWVTGRVAKAIRQRSALVHSASNDLSRLAGGITERASTTASQAQAATNAAEQVASSIEAVNVAVEELSACIQEIASNAAVATTIAGDAVVTAADSNRIITQLGSSSQEIDQVVKVINDIAEQTNLLALNATIEAARAGESGRGFSVVATEVKDLASETARATGEIAGRVAAIQRDTAAAVEANQRINAIIERISEYQHNIAAAIEEQSITTAQIARSANDAAVGSSAISSTVGSVAAEATQTFAAGDNTAQQASQLTTLADDLNALVGVTVRR